jgi:hypothetical protein
MKSGPVPTAAEGARLRVIAGKHLLSGIQKRFLAILRFPELALVFVRFDHVARVIVNTNHGII